MLPDTIAWGISARAFLRAHQPTGLESALRGDPKAMTTQSTVPIQPPIPPIPPDPAPNPGEPGTPIPEPLPEPQPEPDPGPPPIAGGRMRLAR